MRVIRARTDLRRDPVPGLGLTPAQEERTLRRDANSLVKLGVNHGELAADAPAMPTD